VPAWRLTDRTLELKRPIGAGIVNVTDDSMFEGARSGTPEGATEDGLALAEAGFEMLDVGAVAARSGPPVPPREEAAKLIPAIESLVSRIELPLSADTFSPEVARAALGVGVVAINDI
jgi:dihydropteroate synthase